MCIDPVCAGLHRARPLKQSPEQGTPEQPSPAASDATTVPGDDDVARRMALQKYMTATPPQQLRSLTVSPSNPSGIRRVPSGVRVLDYGASSSPNTPTPAPAKTHDPDLTSAPAPAHPKKPTAAKSKSRPVKQKLLRRASKIVKRTSSKQAQAAPRELPTPARNTLTPPASVALPRQPLAVPGAAPSALESGDDPAQTTSTPPATTHSPQPALALPGQASTGTTPAETKPPVKHEVKQPALVPEASPRAPSLLNRATTVDVMDLDSLQRMVQSSVDASLAKNRSNHEKKDDASTIESTTSSAKRNRDKVMHARRNRFYRSLDSNLV